MMSEPRQSARTNHRALWSLGAPLPADNWRVVELLRSLANRVLPQHVIDIHVLWGPGRGLRLPIDPQREKFYWRGALDLAVARYIAQTLRPGQAFWDVGAHIGYMSLIA